MGTFFILLGSYIFLLVTVPKHSSGGTSKALSTLSAHITVVVFFFGPCVIVYVWPFPTLPIDKFLTVFDVLTTPFMNPIIYTFRNKEVKVAMRRLLVKVLSFRKTSFMHSPRNSASSWLLLEINLFTLFTCLFSLVIDFNIHCEISKITLFWSGQFFIGTLKILRREFSLGM